MNSTLHGCTGPVTIRQMAVPSSWLQDSREDAGALSLGHVEAPICPPTQAGRETLPLVTLAPSSGQNLVECHFYITPRLTAQIHHTGSHGPGLALLWPLRLSISCHAMWEEKWGPLCSEAHMGHCGAWDRLSFQLLRRALYYPNWKMVSGRRCNALWGFRAPNGQREHKTRC